MTEKIKGLRAKAQALILMMATRASCRLFLLLYRRPWTGVPDLVNMHVRNQTVANIKHFLLANRIRHCERCLGIGRPLTKTATGFECDAHLVKA